MIHLTSDGFLLLKVESFVSKWILKDSNIYFWFFLGSFHINDSMQLLITWKKVERPTIRRKEQSCGCRKITFSQIVMLIAI